MFSRAQPCPISEPLREFILHPPPHNVCAKKCWRTKWLVVNPRSNLASYEDVLHPFLLRHGYMRSVLGRARRVKDFKSGGPE